MSNRPRLLLVVVLTLLASVTLSGLAIDREGVLYLTREPGQILLAGLNLSDLSLRPAVPTRQTERELAQGVPFQSERSFGPFFSAASEGPSTIDVENAQVEVYLTTGSQGLMQCCAEVTATLARERPASTSVLAERTIITSLGPKRPDGSDTPVVIAMPVEATAGLRALENGDGISLLVSVRNRCQDQDRRNLTLRYDGQLFASRVRFLAEPLDPATSADEDDDGVVTPCDNCPVAPNPNQADGNFNGIGDVCEPCTFESPVPAFCTCIDSVCEDEDPCTVDSCRDGEGCQADSLAGLEGLTCRVDFLARQVNQASPPDVTPRLTRRRSPLRRTAAKAGRAVLKLSRAIQRDKPSNKVGRKLAKVGKVLTSFEAKVDKLAAKGRVDSAFRERLLGISAGALANVEQIRP
jgi:hypothetical protein